MAGAARTLGMALLLAGAARAWAQPMTTPPTPESLRASLATLQGRERVAALLDLANALEVSSPQEALGHVREGLALAIQQGDKEKETAFLTTAAYCHIQTGDFNLAIEQGRKALSLAEALGNQDRAGKAHNILGTAYTFMGVYSRALEEGMEALRIREALGQENAIALSLNLLGVIHHQSGQYEKAIGYYDQILKRLETHPNTKRLILAKINKGFAQNKLGRLEEALRNHQEALALAESSGESAYLNYTHFNLGLTYSDLRQFERARHYLDLADAEYRGQNQKHGLVQVLNARARLCMLTGKLAQAIPLARECAELAEKIHARDELKKSYELLSELHGRLGQTSESFRYFRLATATKDSIYTIQESTRIAEASMKLVTMKKDNEIEALKKERMISALNSEKQRYVLIIFVTCTAFLVTIVLLLVRYTKRLGHTRKTLERTNADLQDKINEIRTLSGLLPICSQCKKIRDDAGYWNQLEGYISERTEATFSHGICPHCAEDLYPEAMARLRSGGPESGPQEACPS